MAGDISNRYLSTAEAALRLGYTVQHTRLLIRRGVLTAQKFGRDWLVDSESVQRLLDSQRISSEDTNAELR